MKLRVTIGYQADFSPFMFDDGGPRGLVVDRLSPLIALETAEVQWVPLTLTAQLDALRSGEVDVLAALGVTAVREEELVFGPNLVRTGGALFRMRGASGPPRRIATPSAGPLSIAAGEAFAPAEVMLVADYPAALDAVVDGSADAAALNVHVGEEIARRHHPRRFAAPDQPFASLALAPATLRDTAGAALLQRLGPIEPER